MKKDLWAALSLNYLGGQFIALLKWLGLSAIIGALVGGASAFFLWSLDWVTTYREAHVWLIALLPLAGLGVGLVYHYWGQSVAKGNNLLIEEYHQPRQRIPFKMAPIVLYGTLMTHLFGGSAGREGTAVQMGGAIADQLTPLFRLSNADRKVILTMGISAGFASVFGTPLAGAIFALEVMTLASIRHEAILPSFLAAVFANYTTLACGITHTLYPTLAVPELNPLNLLYVLVAGLAFGLTAWAFIKTHHVFSDLAKRYIAYAPLRPVFGGLIIALTVLALGSTKYIGLGVPTIVEAFATPLPSYDFALKLLLTTFTLGLGFKGGEVTPLFFIGATLGNALALVLPLPMPLLAGMGFVGVFAGATNTPIACTLMGIELFGASAGVYIALACVLAYLFSGKASIYAAQVQTEGIL